MDSLLSWLVSTYVDGYSLSKSACNYFEVNFLGNPGFFILFGLSIGSNIFDDSMLDHQSLMRISVREYFKNNDICKLKLKIKNMEIFITRICYYLTLTILGRLLDRRCKRNRWHRSQIQGASAYHPSSLSA